LASTSLALWRTFSSKNIASLLALSRRKQTDEPTTLLDHSAVGILE
jgi:hypothetical protein